MANSMMQLVRPISPGPEHVMPNRTPTIPPTTSTVRNSSSFSSSIVPLVYACLLPIRL
jgi:hypothetical protein